MTPKEYLERMDDLRARMSDLKTRSDALYARKKSQMADTNLGRPKRTWNDVIHWRKWQNTIKAYKDSFDTDLIVAMDNVREAEAIQRELKDLESNLDHLTPGFY